MEFCTAINCMDGRVQQPVIEFMKKRFRAQNVDLITEAGPNRILAEQHSETTIQSIFQRVDISVSAHKSKVLAVVGHYDCAGNPVGKEEQVKQISSAIQFLRDKYPRIIIIGLWVNEKWEVEELTSE